jgi:hypothetical protein
MTIETCRLPRIDVAQQARCGHEPPCPASWAPGRLAARVVAFHPEQGWSLLCNGIIVFDDSDDPILPGLPPGAVS